LALDNLLYTLS